MEVRQIGPGTPSRSFHYQGKNDAGLFVTRYVDATGRETRFRYDANGQIHEMEAAATGDLLVRSWENRRMTSLTMPGGETTTWTYQLDDVATRIDPSGNVTTFEYDRSAVDRLQPLRTPLVSVVDGVGVVETRSYDPQGRLLTVTNGEGEMTTFSYGVDEALATQTLPNGVVIAFQGYGPHGRPTAVEIDGTSYPYAYDLVGNRLSGEAPLLGFEDGGVVAREYDADRNAVRIQVWDYFAGLAPTLPEPEAVEIAYRSDKRPLSIQRPGGADHGFQYDAFGREILRSEKVDGVWRATSLGYDAEGRPTSFLLANGMGRQITYDPAGRPYYVQVTRNGAHEGTLGFSYSTGRLTGLFDSTAGQETYQYDAAGRVAEAGFAQGERVVLEYDLRSRVVAEHLWMPGSVPLRSIHRSYDRVGRKTELRDGQTPLVLREFAGGSLLEEVFGNGLRRSYAYDAGAGFLDGTTMAGAGGQVVETTTMDHGWAGAMAYVRATTTTSVGAAATTFEGYWVGPVAASGSWTQGKRLAGIEPSPFPFATYDVLSNQVSDGATTLAYYNTEKNRLLSSSSWTGAASYTYDEAGFTTSRNGEPLTWTATGRLASLGSTLALSWDLLGRLVSTTVAGQTTRFLFGGRVEADEQGNPRAIELGSVRIGLDGSGRRYRHADFRDNVKFVTGDDGAVLTHYRYHPYGVTETFGSTADAIRFVGGRQVGDLVLLGARVLDPVVGRFLSQDPILNLINQYTYTLGNPIWFSDPTGLHPASSAQAIGFALTVEAGALTMMGVAAAGAPPLVVGIAAGVFLLGVISAGLLVFGGNAGTGEANEPSGSGSSGGGEGGGAGAGASVTTSTSSSAPVCTPSDLSRVPDVGWSLLILGPLQLMLGMAIVIRHRRRPRG